MFCVYDALECFYIVPLFSPCLFCIPFCAFRDVQELLPFALSSGRLLCWHLLMVLRLLVIVAVKEFGARMSVWTVTGSHWPRVCPQLQDSWLAVGDHGFFITLADHASINPAHTPRIYVVRLLRLFCRCVAGDAVFRVAH